MTKTANKTDRKSKESIQISWLSTLVGFVLFCTGLAMLIWGSPRIGFSLKYFQPFVENGSVTMILGLLFFSIGLYRLINRKKILNEELEIEKKEQSRLEQIRLKTMGYTVRQKRKNK